MADQWRRMIHPVRSKQSQIPPDIDETTETLSISGSLVSGRRTRPRLGHRISSILTKQNDSCMDEPFTWDYNHGFAPPNDTCNKTDPLDIIESFMTVLYTNGTRPLSPHHNGNLLRIFEDYRKVREVNEKLKEQVEELESNLEDVLERSRESENKWAKEEDDWRKEIKRLELVIAQGSKGMTALMHARQGSVVDRKRKHTYSTATQFEERLSVADVLEDHDEDYVQQRIEQKARVDTSILYNKDAEISRILAKTGVQTDLPVGTPPTTIKLLTRSGGKYSPSSRPFGGRMDKGSDDGFSTAGDPLPDEVDDKSEVVVECPNQSSDMVALKHFAAVVARRGNHPIEGIMPTLLDLFNTGATAAEQVSKASSAPNNANIAFGQPGNDHGFVLAAPPTRKPSRSSLDTIESRPFSFIAGDDDKCLDRARNRHSKSLDTPTQFTRSLSGTIECSLPTHYEAIGHTSSSPLADYHTRPKPSTPRIPKSISTVRIGSASPHVNTPNSKSMGFNSPRESNPESTESVTIAVRQDIRNDSRRSSNNNPRHKGSQGLLEQQRNTTNNPIALAAARAVDALSGERLGASKEQTPGKPVKNVTNRHQHRAKNSLTRYEDVNTHEREVDNENREPTLRGMQYSRT